MLHAWNLVTLAFGAGIASLSFLRGVAGLVVGLPGLARLEAATLTLVGVGGWLAVLAIHSRPG